MKHVYSRGLMLLSALVLSVMPLLVQAQDTIIHYTETTGFNHGTAAVSLALFQQIGQEQNFVVLQDGDGNLFNKTTLAQAKVVVFSNTSGSSGLNSEQRAALEWFVDTLGRHLLGIHAASDTYRHSSANGGNTGAWDWYAETLGGSVQSTPNHTSQNHVDTIYLIQEHPSTDNIGFPWVKEEEYYYWQNGYLNSDIEIILEVGQTGNNSWDQQRPVAWYRTNPQGAKVYYTSLGHKLSNFTGAFPEFEQLLQDAMAWLLEGCPMSVTELEAAICAGESYEFDGQEFTDAGMYSLTLQDAAGCDSVVLLTLVVLPPDTTAISAEICQGESYTFGAQALTAAGAYPFNFPDAAGCDSIVNLMLSVFSVDVEVAQDGPTLTAAAVDAVYQWVDCDNDDAPIAGATGRNFTPITGGNYAVLVTTPQGCTARSDCFEVMVVSTNESNGLSGITVYPNPAVSRLVVDFPILLPEVQVAVYTLEGKKLWERRLAQAVGPLEISLDGWAAGVYLLRAGSLPLGAEASWKFIKN